MSGKNSISDRVFTRIINSAASSVAGVETLSSSWASIGSRGYPWCDFDVNPLTEEIRVESAIAVSWPSPATAVAQQVQRSIERWLKDMTGYTATRIDVTVEQTVPGPRRITEAEVSASPFAPTLTPIQATAGTPAVTPTVREGVAVFSPDVREGAEAVSPTVTARDGRDSSVAASPTTAAERPLLEVSAPEPTELASVSLPEETPLKAVSAPEDLSTIEISTPKERPLAPVSIPTEKPLRRIHTPEAARVRRVNVRPAERLRTITVHPPKEARRVR